MWGEEAQIVAAREVIQGILLKCNILQRGHNGKKPEWPKIMAHSVNKEANAEMVERHEDMIVQLRKAPELPYVFPEQVSEYISSLFSLTNSTFSIAAFPLAQGRSFHQRCARAESRISGHHTVQVWLPCFCLEGCAGLHLCPWA